MGRKLFEEKIGLCRDLGALVRGRPPLKKYEVRHGERNGQDRGCHALSTTVGLAMGKAG